MLVPRNSTLRIAASLTLVFAALGLAPAVLGATFTVTNTLNTGAGSLRQAVLDSNAAATSDVIVFDAGVFSTPQTIVLNSVITINPAAGDSLTITGPGAALLTLSGNEVTSIIDVGAGDTATISGIRFLDAIANAIQNVGDLTVIDCVFHSNTGAFGGAIYTTGTALTVTNSTFTENTATSGSATGQGGGAIHQNNGLATTTISGSTFTDNAEIGNSGCGGAMRNRSGIVNISNSVFTGNTCVDNIGGGALMNSDRMTISGSTFTGNSTSVAAGGAISSGGTLTITGSLIDANSSVADGGGLNLSGTATIINSTISNNIANSDAGAAGNGRGGGIYSIAALTITGSTITGNQALGNGGARGVGGGIAITGGTLTLTNSTVSGNSAGQTGGGMHLSGTSTVTTDIESSTIVNNTASLIGGGIVRGSSSNPVNLHNSIFANNTDNGTAPNIQGTVVSQDYNLIEVTTGATITGTTANNITGQDPNLGPLANNLGPTPTHALLPGSPAIGTADPDIYPVTDQRGLARPQNGDNSGAALPDIGSFELFVPTAAPVTVTGRVLANSRPIRGAWVSLAGASGDTLTTVTNSFGYFRFTSVSAGEDYVLSVAAKGYRFSSQLIHASSDISGLIIEAQPTRFDLPRVQNKSPDFRVEPEDTKGTARPSDPRLPGVRKSPGKR